MLKPDKEDWDLKMEHLKRKENQEKEAGPVRVLSNLTLGNRNLNND